MECDRCKREGAELHHIVYRSQSRIMEKMPINFIYLCYECHRGKDGPHHNRKRDLELKAQVQSKLEKTLCKPYYTPEGLKKALKISDNQLRQITKVCKPSNEGYDKKEIIFYLMGQKFYKEVS
jgi:hypothetical protein